MKTRIIETPRQDLKIQRHWGKWIVAVNFTPEECDDICTNRHSEIVHLKDEEGVFFKGTVMSAGDDKNGKPLVLFESPQPGPPEITDYAGAIEQLNGSLLSQLANLVREHHEERKAVGDCNWLNSWAGTEQIEENGVTYDIDLDISKFEKMTDREIDKAIDDLRL